MALLTEARGAGDAIEEIADAKAMALLTEA
jgi:hypothetical protein